MYKVGDVLKVREWDDMLDEFGYDEDRQVILCEFYFNSNMRYMCGKTFTVSEVYIDKINGYCRYFSKECIEKNCFISGDMLEPLNGIPEFDVASEDDLNDLLFS